MIKGKKLRRLFVSFSGGKTSAYLTNELVPMLHEWDEVIVGFANTGEEHEKTLEYVHKCDQHYNWNVVWLEAVFDPRKGFGTRHRVVSFETAARKGGAIYPLIDWGITKEDVQAWEMKQPVRLGIPEHLGNCVWCWKKSFRKLATVASETPDAFRFPAYLEARYRDHGPGFGDRRLFRSRKATADIFAMARDPAFEPFVDGFQFKDEAMDFGSSCGETCEIGVDNGHDTGLHDDYDVI
jgi:hypothetical protein